MKVGILGAGITGLSLARLLNKHFDVEVIEKQNHCGGIARTKDVSGMTYHTIGGHCFNSKYPEVLDFVFNQILPLDQWQKIKRKSMIKFENYEIEYPIEYSITKIYEFDKDLAIKITIDFLKAQDDKHYYHLEDWFRKKFGDTLSDLYFIPYNTKIWNRKLTDMSPEWIKDKLPIPDKYSFFEGLMHSVEDNMPHSEFYYPISNNQNTFIEAMATGIDIKYNTAIYDIQYDKKLSQWILNGTMKYDIVISTLPLNELPYLIKDTPSNILDAAALLKYNVISNVFWKSRKTDKTWTYIPNKESIFHRYIHIGSFFNPKEGYTISEVVGSKSFKEIIENGQKDTFLLEPLEYNTSEHAYVVFDENHNSSTSVIKAYLHEIGLYSIGRFGEWQYYNMDVCIKKSLDLSKEIINGKLCISLLHNEL